MASDSVHCKFTRNLLEIYSKILEISSKIVENPGFGSRKAPLGGQCDRNNILVSFRGRSGSIEERIAPQVKNLMFFGVFRQFGGQICQK